MVQFLLDSVALFLAIPLLLPVIVLAAECFAGSFGTRKDPDFDAQRPAIAVLVPAHNEEMQITATIRNILSQLQSGDRLVVVADNCSDDTALLAREAGAEVVQRRNQMLRGKGYAIDAGVRYLAADPREIVVVVDADCVLEAGAIDTLARMTETWQRPVQSRYLMVAPPNTGAGLAVSEFAFLLKNRIRCLGLTKLGFPVQLTGSGMAFPWPLLQDMDLATGHLVEDMKLGLDLAEAGYAPQFCDAAVVRSTFPYSQKALKVQASRWDDGRAGMTSSLLRALLKPKTFQNREYLALLVDALVPPLSLLAAMLVAVLAATGLIASLGGNLIPHAIAVFAAVLFFGSVTAAWYQHGRQILPVRSLREIPAYAAWKVARVPLRVLRPGGSVWIRTDRAGPADV
ncbi:glycosyltransferase family 2 protein [Rhizobium sp. NTR19]|uniref:Glycosyltransferase family 2 protein n=1 Tax=Neorhizobium turbinariae TaxID=2937795 RepID=A0ABT0IX57_9HYPH|nr:glycosyltransferase family 2 protein [Neorhizobium turbinariae]MCK8782448.1 glycosyltransferase family 2 protein [Neorhizobium turbinariae]